jgi:hypothetical protein
VLRFLARGREIAARVTQLRAIDGCQSAAGWLDWVESPPGATHLQLTAADPAAIDSVREVSLHLIAERDPKCHPSANVPRWSSYLPAGLPRDVVIPSALDALLPHLDFCETTLLQSPRNLRALLAAADGRICVLDPQWVERLGLTLRDLERIAARSWLIIDLPALAEILRRAGVRDTAAVTHRSPHGLMSARVECADAPTRGFALQDVMPYGMIDAEGRFELRALPATRGWMRFADRTGFATLLSSETPWSNHHAEVLSAARPTAGGELIATDLPWLAAGRLGRPVAPRLARHLLRTHLCGPLEDDVQFWNRWSDWDVVVRDIGDFARRYPPLRAARWASDDPGVARLGLALPARSNCSAHRFLFLATGRIDDRGMHDGLPAEPMILFMKFLARDVREQSEWATRHLSDRTIVWQFDTAAGLRYAPNYDAGPQAPPEEITWVRVRMRPADGGGAAVLRPDGATTVSVAADQGILGDGSFAFQRDLNHRLRAVIERDAQRSTTGMGSTVRVAAALGVE